jgi:hypothetical protein
MTRNELAVRLDHLDPGGSLSVDAQQLAKAFGAGALSDEVIRAAEAFAEQHRCTLVRDEHDRQPPQFVKDDVF